MVWQHLEEGSSRILGWLCNIFLLRGYCTVLHSVALPGCILSIGLLGRFLLHVHRTQYGCSLLPNGRTISQAGATKAIAGGSCCPSAILEAPTEVGAV